MLLAIYRENALMVIDSVDVLWYEENKTQLQELRRLKM